MRQKVVVVELPSLFNLDPLDEKLTHFALLGFPVTLKIDVAELQKRFHELSKQVHPDKFVLKTPKEQSLAMRWSTRLNRAYQTLKDYDARANYVLTLYGKSRTANAKVPVELAESYFEMQDLLEESSNPAPLVQFKNHLLELKANSKKEWEQIESLWEKEVGSSSVLNRISDQLNFEHYLNSMLEDVSKKLGEI